MWADSASGDYTQTDNCTSSQYSQCETAADCELRIGPGCECFVSSCLHPYNPCEGNECNMVGCSGEECGAYQVECVTENDTGGICLMVNQDVVTSSPPGVCSSSGGALAIICSACMFLLVVISLLF